jgi:tRNA nucleotidyltransferase (CCA-adding enzyme)
MKIYRVGGSVRDELLDRPVADRDFVVVGATPEEMRARGFRAVGRDFPVFLHPESGEEYALARTERKRGRGHRGFSFHAAPEVTLEQDLARRDLTINAMARAADGTLIDPFDGAGDLRAGILRHIGPSFVEDPLRVLRVARFAARFGFDVAPETEALLRAIADGGELATLAPERVWQEVARALMEQQPSQFFLVLHRCGALAQLMPEIDALFTTPSRAPGKAVHSGAAQRMRAVDLAAAAREALAVRYAVLACDLASPVRAGRSTSGTARAGRNPQLAASLSRRLKAPAECRDLAELVARHRGSVDRAAELTAPALLDLLVAVDALRRGGRFEQFLRACALDWASRSKRAGADRPAAQRLREARAVVAGVNAGAIAHSGRDRGDLVPRIRAARLKALRDWRALARSRMRRRRA